jgi:dolichol-phosphate mannosyltransferase
LSKNLVIIPTYNEKENIESILQVVMDLRTNFDVLVVDDGSPDGTARLVKAFQQNFPQIHILERSGKLGLGTAYIAGFKWALERDYDYIFEMDADFSHKPADLERLLEACVNGADMSIGSRYVQGGDVKNWTLDRIILSKGAAIYVNSVLWLGVKDCTAGFVCYHKSVLQAIDLDEIRFIGYAFQIEMKYTAKKLGFKLAEVPIAFEDRKLGTSKMSMGIFNEAFTGVWKMRFGKLARKK